MTRFERSLMFAYCLNAVDVVITVYVVYGKDMVEVNPFMANLLMKHPALFASVKLLAMAWVCGLLMERHEIAPGETSAALNIVIGLLVLICTWQVSMLAYTFGV